MRYAVFIEKGPTGYGAYVPDLPGCVAVGESLDEVRKLIADAVALHIEGLQEDGLPAPEPVTECQYVEVLHPKRIAMKKPPKAGKPRESKQEMLPQYRFDYSKARPNRFAVRGPSETHMHNFTLIVSGVDELTPELADRLYAATDGDIELSVRDGVAFVEFERPASTLEAAIASAISQIQGADAALRVVRVESEDVNVTAKINAGLLRSTSR